MATILEFRASDDKPVAKPAKRKRQSAEIVIFPGVRYERWEFAAPAASGAAGGQDASKASD